MSGGDMRAPFPWFGGKSRAAHLVWGAFGDVANYVEPFAGSLAVLLSRPHAARIETVNDLDCYLANFWRATQADPVGVAAAADWPVNEADLSARHQWLIDQHGFRERMKTDPDFFDSKIAGWWVWGLCSWISSGWCAPRPVGKGVHRKLPHLGNAGVGVNRGAGRGVNRQLPRLDGQGFGVGVTSEKGSDFGALAARLRRVRVACGDWTRVLGDSVTRAHGLTGVMLDPPYADTAGRDPNLYAEDSLSVAHDVRQWAIENGGRRQMRIALCGYEGEHEMPADWQCVEWKAKGGYGSQAADGNENAKRERIWFSPHCDRARDQGSLFSGDQ